MPVCDDVLRYLPIPSLVLSEGEHVGLDAGLKEGDLEGAIRDRSRLANQLIEPLLYDHAVARLVDVEPMRAVRRFSVDQKTEGRGRPSRLRA
jgi:hypothetical protein